jgi:hypothetical protein
MLPGPKHEPLSTRSDPRTLKALREHIHRKFPTPMFRLYEHRETRKQAPEPKRPFGDEQGKQPRGDVLPSYKRTMQVLRRAVVAFPSPRSANPGAQKGVGETA